MDWLGLPPLIVSSLVGAVVGLSSASATNYLNSRYQTSRDAKKYRFILSNSSAELSGRLERILGGGAPSDWLQREKFEDNRSGYGFVSEPSVSKGYFALSTTYVLLRFFASLELMRIATNSADIFELTNLNKQYQACISAADALRSSDVLLGHYEVDRYRDCDVLTRHIQSSIGQLVLDFNGGNPRLIPFIEFVDLYRRNERLREWCKCVDEYFIDLVHTDKQDPRVIRLKKMQIHLQDSIDERAKRTITKIHLPQIASQ